VVDSELWWVDEAEKEMHSLHYSQHLAVAVPLSLLLLLVGVVELGLAVCTGDLVPPKLDVHIAHMHVAADVGQNPDCPPHIQCPLQAGAPAQAYVVVWSIDDLSTAGQPDGRTAHRLLVVPLQR